MPSAPPRQTRIMSRVGHSFDCYLRERDGVEPLNLSNVRGPCERGLVSVVLPTFNGERFLAEAIESVLNQSHERLELIVVNDGSTDATPTIVDRYVARDPRVRSIRQTNQKLPRALNAGFAVARGEFLTWTSDDNVMGRRFLESMIDVLNAKPHVDMVYTDYELIDAEGRPGHNSPFCAEIQNPPGSGRIRLPRDVSMLNLVKGNYIGPAFLYRERVRLLIGDYDPRYYTCEDYDYFLRINERLNLRHAGLDDTSLYCYREHGGSLSAHGRQLGIGERVEDLLRIDVFRRDLTFAPICWIWGGEGKEFQFEGWDFRRTLIRSGGRLDSLWGDIGAVGGAPDDVCRHLPTIYLRATPTPGSTNPPPANLPEHCLRVLLDTSDAPLPGDVDPSWDLCLTIRTSAVLPRLKRDRSGWLAVGDPFNLLRVLRIRVLADFAQHFEDFIDREREATGECDASVIICTDGRRPILSESLEAVASQTLAPDRYEIVIVASRPVRDLAPTVEAFRERFSRTHLVHSPPAGLSLARNVGLAASRGRVVVYLDDDVIVSPSTLEHLLAVFDRHPNAGVVGGTIDVDAPNPPPWWWGEATGRYWAGFHPSHSYIVEPGRWQQFPYGGNWAARRADLLAIGGFRLRYGRFGRAVNSGEETVATIEIQRLGRDVVIEPAARVRHAVEPNRFKLRSLVRTTIDNSRFRLALDQDQLIDEPTRLVDNLWHAAKRVAWALRPSRTALPSRIEHLLIACGCMTASAGLLRMYVHRVLRRPRWE